jgi:hypothetical protein
MSWHASSKRFSISNFRAAAVALRLNRPSLRHMESGHDRVQRHTGAAHADGSARGGEQGGIGQPSWTPHLGDRQVHSLDGDGFRRLRHNAFQCPNVVCDRSQQNDALAVLDEFELVAGFDAQSL